jgi:hypothetical protein
MKGAASPNRHEAFSSSGLAGLNDVAGFGQLPGLQREAPEFAQDAPSLS